MEKKVYPLNNGSEYKTIEIYADYELGGYSYFSGEQQRRGYYCYFKPFSDAGRGFRSSSMMGSTRDCGCKIFLEGANKKSAKRLQELNDQVNAVGPHLRDMFNDGKYSEAQTFLGDTIKARFCIAKVDSVALAHAPEKKSLLTKELLDRFAVMGSQENESDPIIIAKFFDPCGAGTWYATEYDPKDKIFFGYVTLGMGDGFDEWGNFSLDELESVRGKMGLGIERDRHFSEQRASEIIKSKVTA